MADTVVVIYYDDTSTALYRNRARHFFVDERRDAVTMPSRVLISEILLACKAAANKIMADVALYIMRNGTKFARSWHTAAIERNEIIYRK